MILFRSLRQANAVGYNVPFACDFKAADTSSMTLAFGAGGNRKKWTRSVWIKRNNVSLGGTASLFGAHSAGSNYDSIDILTSNKLEWYSFVGGYVYRKITTATIADSLWHHLVFGLDTDHATAADRCKLWIDGTRIAAFDSETDPSSGASSCYFNSNLTHTLGYNASLGAYQIDAKLAEHVMVDGQQLDADQFGMGTPGQGTWLPKSVTDLLLDADDYYLDFATAADMGNDAGPNNRDWTEVSLGAEDQITDTPTNPA